MKNRVNVNHVMPVFYEKETKEAYAHPLWYSTELIIDSDACETTLANDRLNVNCLSQCSQYEYIQRHMRSHTAQRLFKCKLVKCVMQIPIPIFIQIYKSVSTRVNDHIHVAGHLDL